MRALTRNPAPGRLPPEVDVRAGDAVSGDGLAEALDGCRTAYYLIHSMEGRGGGFAARDREAAVNFGEAARAPGVERVIYLGGLGERRVLGAPALAPRGRRAARASACRSSSTCAPR